MVTVSGPEERIFALFGHPVAHSVSPVMHNAAFAATGMNYRYVSFDVKPGDLAAAVAAIKALGLGGVNVTIPHKERVPDFLDGVDEQARRIGAVNTIVPQDGRLLGYNTDAPGFLESLRVDAGFNPRGKRAVVLGAGGAARAVTCALASAGVAHLAVFNRNPARAGALAGDLAGWAPCPVEAGNLEGDALPRALAEADLLVNATPVGMCPHTGEHPLPDPAILPPGLLVYDLIYNPPRTLLLQEATARGCREVSGVGMLVFQGAFAFELWTGRRAPVAVMRAAVERALGASRGERI